MDFQIREKKLQIGENRLHYKPGQGLSRTPLTGQDL